jgi:hydrogenase expression/formation protein HypE
MKDDCIILAHGGGGSKMNQLIREHFMARFGGSSLQEQGDAAHLSLPGNKLVFTTDAFVVDPIFFPGGDIGKLSVCGTLNDLAVAGGHPLFLSVSVILEEGLPLDELDRIIDSMAETAREAGIKIVAGDTKVVPRGKGDKIFITTTGIGSVEEDAGYSGLPDAIQPGDKILVNGTVGDHGTAILLARESFSLKAPIASDCANLAPLMEKIFGLSPDLRFARDATRGGMATVLCEAVDNQNFGFELDEDAVPIDPAVDQVCDLLGMDPLYMANEGKVVLVAPAGKAEKLLDVMKHDPLGKKASIVGSVTTNHPGKVVMHTRMGGTRWLDYLSGDQLPRIC